VKNFAITATFPRFTLSYATHIFPEFQIPAMLKQADTLKKSWDIIMKPVI
jgi:hypothetical protein